MKPTVSSSPDWRKTRKWQALRLYILARSQDCHLCGLPLDPTAPARTRWASTVDHIVPVNAGGDVYDVGNLAGAHHGCNSSKQDKVDPRRSPNASAVRPSRPW